MLFKLAHYILSHFPFLWAIIENINSLLFVILYKERLKNIPDIANEGDAEALALFFSQQPESAYTYFRPHAFDIESLRKLLKHKSMVVHVVYQDNKIIGYCFLRCFFIGKGYRGYIVDSTQQKKGIGKKMGLWLNNAASTLRIRTYKTINNNNAASLNLARATCLLIVTQELQNGDVEYECVNR